MSITESGESLSVKWANDNHESLYNLNWLRTHSYYPRLISPSVPATRPKHLWDASLASSLPTVNYNDVMSSDTGLAEWLKHIDTYGIGFVDGVPITPEATEELAKRVAFIRHTHYGGFWDFTPNMEHGDTAYTTLALPGHTDTSYFTEPIGLQLFHLLEHKGKGGQSLYVDAFNAAKQLRDRFPDAYEILSRFPVTAHCAGDEGIHITPSAPFTILEHDPANPSSLMRVRYNNDDRSVISPHSLLSSSSASYPISSASSQQLRQFSPTEIPDFYHALSLFTKLIRDRKNELWVPLKPGKAVMVDNWRVLHGRAEFSGFRRLVGCYIGWDDYRSRVRTLVDGKGGKAVL
ncbi:hypothetical protein HK097_008529 [Rhizophlyctis rosea]|uniref:TauD/TfdA-like domain-containing protein n=1 Tax=Rhizophlyctis rosea TaxID=64517 RepID=A0AAD5SA77_9FUNG|nr:hypothetical protein HK097_008529 [Rhizophlyctis rosea]